MAEKCLMCENTVQLYFYCDEDKAGGPFCRRCFDRHPCRTQPHDEGCETRVVDTNPKETGNG